MSIVRRNFGFAEIKLAPPESDESTFSGYGAVFNNVDAYGDVIVPGAFAETLSDAKKTGQWPAMLLQHGGGLFGDDQTPIGIWTDLIEDKKGLRVEGKLADTTKGREIYSLLKMQPRPAINGLSIGYRPKEWEARTKPEDPRRKLKRVELVEISLVTFPANGKARVESIKSIEDLENLADVENLLRDASGFSRTETKTLVARIKSLALRDAVDGVAGIAAAITRNVHTLRSLKP